MGKFTSSYHYHEQIIINIAKEQINVLNDDVVVKDVQKRQHFIVLYARNQIKTNSLAFVAMTSASLSMSLKNI
jgi:hypothetical protein